MLGNIVKWANERTPEVIKEIFAPVIRLMLTNNKNFKKTYNLLNKLNDKEQLEYQKSQVKDLMSYVYENCEYYNKNIDLYQVNLQSQDVYEELKKLPIMKREDVISNYSQMISKEKIRFYHALTGGTTGEALDIIQDYDSIMKEKAYIYHYWSKLGYDYKTSKLLTFRGAYSGNKLARYNPVYNEIIVSPFMLTNESVQDYLDIIDQYKPEYIQGYPTTMKNLCRIIEEENCTLSVKLKGMFFISEEVKLEDRQYIEKVLGCPSLAFYGHTERSVFGEEIKHNDYVFNNTYGYTELIPTLIPDEYQIIVTGLINRKMPLLRYDTGDIAIIKEGQTFIKSHCDKFVYGYNRENIDLSKSIFTMEGLKSLKKYQFIQNEIGKIELNILDNIEPLGLKKLEEELNNEFLGVLDFTVNKVEKLKLTKRGKQQNVVQNCNLS